MRVVGVDAEKVLKLKAVLVVKIRWPPSLEDTQIELYCTSLEPKTKLGQGGDFTLLTAIRKTLPRAKSLYDICVRDISADYTTQTILACCCNSDWETITVNHLEGIFNLEYQHVCKRHNANEARLLQ